MKRILLVALCLAMLGCQPPPPTNPGGVRLIIGPTSGYSGTYDDIRITENSEYQIRFIYEGFEYNYCGEYLLITNTKE